MEYDENKVLTEWNYSAPNIFLHADFDKHPSYTSNQLCFYDGWNFWTTKKFDVNLSFAFQKAAKLWRHATINITTATPDDGQERRRQFIPLVTQETTGNLQSVFKNSTATP